MENPDVTSVLTEGMYHRLFPERLRTIPNLNEVYELALAFYESRLLSESEILRTGAYFWRVGSEFTRHFLMCTGDPLRLPIHSSSRLRSFFQSNQFRTGYATHGLFPYRGKFHPQMIKGLLNIMGLKPGNTVLDPMMGSGTVLIEASLMGIKSIGIDASPFCRFMAQAKMDGLVLDKAPLFESLKAWESLFHLFTREIGQPHQGSKDRRRNTMVGEPVVPYRTESRERLSHILGSDDPKLINFLLLAYLDSAGYAERSKRKSPLDQFHAILERYVSVVEKIQRTITSIGIELAESIIEAGDARHLALTGESVDGILFSPPYSFAIDYLQNDSFHLRSMGVDMYRLKERMVGLRGSKLREKYRLYLEDMDQVLAECARVLRPQGFCTVVIGTNDNQIAKALGIPKTEVKGLHEAIKELASPHGFSLVRRLSRRISGIANTMRDEYILFLQKRGGAGI